MRWPTLQCIIAVMFAIDLQVRLQDLERERALASVGELGQDVHYMADLDEEIATTRHAHAAAAVVEIATLRASLSGRLRG